MTGHSARRTRRPISAAHGAASRRSRKGSACRTNGSRSRAKTGVCPPPGTTQSEAWARTGTDSLRRALRAAFSCRLGHHLAPHLRRGRQALHRVRRAHDGACGRDGPRVHRPPSRRAASLARPTRRRLTSPPSNARHVAPWPPPVRALAKRPPLRPATAESRPPHAPPADRAPPSCEPSPLRWPHEPHARKEPHPATSSSAKAAGGARKCALAWACCRAGRPGDVASGHRRRCRAGSGGSRR